MCDTLNQLTLTEVYLIAIVECSQILKLQLRLLQYLLLYSITIICIDIYILVRFDLLIQRVNFVLELLFLLSNLVNDLDIAQIETLHFGLAF